jgi:hypothetical protein
MTGHRIQVVALSLLGSGFVFGLSIPRVSFLALLLGTGLLLRARCRLPRAWRLTVPLILAFTLLHDSISIYYGYLASGILLVHPPMFLAAYVLGLALPSVDPFRRGDWMVRFVMLIALGMATFALLGGIFKPIRIEGAELLRKSPTFWDPTLVLNGPIFGLYASAGMVMLPLVLFSGKRLLRLGRVDAWIAGASGVLGLAANILFQNRGPFLALGLSLFWVAGSLLWQPGASGRELRSRVLVRLAWVGCGVLALGLAFFEEIRLVLYRFQSVGLGTNGRSEAWSSILTHFFDQPFGGRRYNLAGLSYAHNMWLDVANDSGLLPLLILILLLCVHLLYLPRAYRGALGLDRQVLFSLLISLTVGAVLEPLLLGSPTHFAFLMLLLGWLVNLGTSTPAGKSVLDSDITLETQANG